MIEYGPSFPVGDAVTAEEVAAAFTEALARVRRDGVQRRHHAAGPAARCFRVGADAAGAVDVKSYGSQASSAPSPSPCAWPSAA